MDSSLINFIAQEARKGTSRDVIINSLLNIGWKLEDVEQAFAEAMYELSNEKNETDKYVPAGGMKVRPRPKASLASRLRRMFPGAPLLYNFIEERFNLLSILIIIFSLSLFPWHYRNDILAMIGGAGSSHYRLFPTDGSFSQVNPDTSFIIESDRLLNEKLLAKLIVIQPDAEFSISRTDRAKTENVALRSGFKAGTSDDQMGLVVSRYEIKPKKELDRTSIYRISVKNDDGASDHDYSWAFQPRTPFNVSWTLPANRSAGVSPETAISMNFNRLGMKSSEEYFSIEPAVTGRTESFFERTVFIPDEALKPDTTYTVTVKKGLPSADGQEKIAEDYVFSFETGGRPQEPTVLHFVDDFNYFLPGKTPALEISIDKLRPDSIDGKIFKFKNSSEFIDSYLSSRDWNLSWSEAYRKSYPKAWRPDEKYLSGAFHPSVSKIEYQSYISLPSALEAGYYVIEISGGDAKSYAWLQISPLAYYYSYTGKTGLLWAYDFLKRVPLDSAQLSYSDPTGDSKLSNSAKNGTFRFATPSQLNFKSETDQPQPIFFRLETNNYQPLEILIKEKWRSGNGDRFWSYLATDRNVYRHQDKLNFWGIAKGRGIDLSQKTLKAGIYSQNRINPIPSMDSPTSESLFSSLDVQVSSMGTVQGEIEIPGLSAGTYYLKLHYGDDEVAAASFEVADYAKPAYQISVRPDKYNVYAGEKIDFLVKAEFFDRTPAGNLELEYSADWKNGYKGRIKLDDQGQGRFSLTPEYYETDGAYYPSNLVVKVRPLEGTEGEIFGQTDLLVFGPHIRLKAENRYLGKNSYQIKLQANEFTGLEKASENSWSEELIGPPASGLDLEAKIIRTDYIKVPQSRFLDPIDKTLKTTYRYDSREQEIENVKIRTGKNGELEFRRNLPPVRDASFRIEFTGQDGQGRKISDTAYLNDFSYNMWKDFSLALALDRQPEDADFSEGEKVVLEAKASTGSLASDLPLLFYRYQNDIDWHQVSTSTILSQDFIFDMAPSVSYKAVALGPYGFEESNPVAANFRFRDKKLAISLEPDKPSYRPRDEIALKIRVADTDGRPHRSEVNLSVVDESVFHLIDSGWRTDVLEGLYRPIFSEPLTDASVYHLSAPDMGAEMGGCFAAGTKILMSDGSYRDIEDIRSGDQIRSTADAEGRGRSSQIVQAVSSHQVAGYLNINDHLKITPEHTIFLNRVWKAAGLARPGDLLQGSDGQPVKIEKISGTNLGRAEVFNIMVGKSHSYFADDILVHNSSKGGARDRFVDTAAFMNVRTEEDGQGEAKFRLPDNITSWRITAATFDVSTMSAGQNVLLVPSTLPFYVDADMGDEFLAGDQPWLRLRALGPAVVTGHPVDYSISASGLNLSPDHLSTAEKAYFPIALPNIGEYDITVSALQGENRDALEKKIRVLPPKPLLLSMRSYSLSNGLTGIAGSSRFPTKLIFSDNISGQFYPILKRMSAFENIRTDYLVSNYSSRKLLNRFFNEKTSEAAPDLSSFLRPDGGISYFNGSAESDPDLTAKVLDLSKELLSENAVKDYLIAQSQRSMALDIHSSSKLLYGFSCLNEPVLPIIYYFFENKGDEMVFEDKLYLSLALARLGDLEGARNIYRDKIRPLMRLAGNQLWVDIENSEYDQIHLTILAALLANRIEYKNDAQPLWNFISSQFEAKKGDPLELTLLIKSMIEDHPSPSSSRFEMEMGGSSRMIRIEEGKPTVFDIFPEELGKIRFSRVSGDISLYSFYEERSDEYPDSSLGLSLDRKYLKNGRITDSFQEGDLINIRFSFSAGQSLPWGNYQISDRLPSGLKPVAEPYRQGMPTRGEVCNPYWHPVIVDGQNIYFQIYRDFSRSAGCRMRTLNYQARAATKGKFCTTPAVIQYIENPNIQARSQAMSVEIK